MTLPYTLTAHTDGACRTSCSDGGFAVVFSRDGEIVRELSFGVFTLTTNNRMELLAAITAVQTFVDDIALRNESVCLEVVSDSKYVVDAVSKDWISRWRSGDFLRDGEPMPNADLWRALCNELERAKASGLIAVFTHVKGHAGDPLNERVDRLAVARSRGESVG